MMIAEGQPAGVVAASVGYDTQSQFTREYKRLFGAPPVADTSRLSGAG
jgi:AraC-like DNA-binding protein